VRRTHRGIAGSFSRAEACARLVFSAGWSSASSAATLSLRILLYALEKAALVASVVVLFGLVVAVGVDEQVGIYVVVVDGDEDELRMDDGYGLAMLQISKVKMCGLNFG
jgi:hypothetical protein